MSPGQQRIAYNGAVLLCWDEKTGFWWPAWMGGESGLCPYQLLNFKVLTPRRQHEKAPVDGCAAPCCVRPLDRLINPCC